jgi:hypothetical protein
MSERSAVTDPRHGYLPMYNPASFELFNGQQRIVRTITYPLQPWSQASIHLEEVIGAQSPKS